MNKTLAKALGRQIVINLAVATAGAVIITLAKKALTPVEAS